MIQLANMADREQPVTLRTRKFIRNALLGRKQMVVWVLLPRSGNLAPSDPSLKSTMGWNSDLFLLQ